MVRTFERTNDSQLMMLLIEMRYEGALDLLLRLLESQKSSERLTAIQELGKLENNKAVPYLIRQLQDKDPLIQGEAVRALGTLGAVETIPTLIYLLVDDEIYGPHSNIYHAVTEAFQMLAGITGEIKNAFPGNYPAMFSIGGAPISLPEAIGLAGNHPGSDFFKEAFSRIQSASQKQVELPPGLPADRFSKVFEDMAWKFGAMFADARDAREERLKRLLELLKSDSGLRRAAAALTLPWYPNEASLPALEQAMRDQDEIASRAATWAFHALQKTLLYRKDLGL